MRKNHVWIEDYEKFVKVVSSCRDQLDFMIATRYAELLKRRWDEGPYPILIASVMAEILIRRNYFSN